VSARYCYAVWLRHLSMLRRSGLPTSFDTMAELGPGDSLGIGLASLLSGVRRYIALDATRYAGARLNLLVFEELISLFRDRTPIPDETEYPLIRPRLQSYEFPADILTPARLDSSLRPERLNWIRESIRNPATMPAGDHPVCYIVPWQPGIIESGTVDLVLSQTVLEYPPDLAGVYSEMCRWLKPGGVMSHEIDFKSFGITPHWNGQWACSDALWQLAAGRRRNRLNREPHSAHLALIRKEGCRLVCDERTVQPCGITRAQLASRFRCLTNDDLLTSSALLQAIKPT
jgi:SAM-dependent methyltransferase